MTNVDGIINVIKPLEWTSMDVVRRMKTLTKQKKLGHAGTLDPQATGVLPICFGQATRIMEYLVDSPKSYEALIHLGVSTDSYDGLGEVTGVRDFSFVSESIVREELKKFLGVFNQIPPMYSALKKNGKRLYNLARAGEEIKLEAREVIIYSMNVIDFRLPEIKLTVECGKGMYVRSLAHDLGESLGCGAYLKELTRLHSGPFQISDAVSIEDVEKACLEGTWQALLYPLDFPLTKFSAAIVENEKEDAVRKGQGVYLGFPSGTTVSDICRLYSDDGNFVGLLEHGEIKGLWRAKKVFNLRQQL